MARERGERRGSDASQWATNGAVKLRTPGRSAAGGRMISGAWTPRPARPEPGHGRACPRRMTRRFLRLRYPEPLKLSGQPVLQGERESIGGDFSRAIPLRTFRRPAARDRRRPVLAADRPWIRERRHATFCDRSGRNARGINAIGLRSHRYAGSPPSSRRVNHHAGPSRAIETRFLASHFQSYASRFRTTGAPHEFRPWEVR